ncbi:MAG: hypothetical protein CVV61_03170 [Tenericutes bacterium HGW-Tenericutes-6]|nr:MAG: hypothetical protein CVV61_03170 [Tenericutes bacterium HGW-Tenericutes-6]
MIKKISLGMLLVLTAVSTMACQSQTNDIAPVYQKGITRIEQFRSELPENYNIIDFKERALQYDEMVFNFEATGTFFPLIWADETYDTYGISAYVGDYRQGLDGSQEAVTAIAAVLSATLLGIDKSNQNGQNFVRPLNVYFNEEEQVVINNPSGNSRNISMWYMIYPAILFTQVSMQYEEELQLRENTLKTIESWYQAYLVMNDLNSFDYTGFDFEEMQPYRNHIWREPDSAVGISLLMYYGYKLTDEEKYKDAAIASLDYIHSDYMGSSMYEILLTYGPYLAALYNLEFGTNFDVGKLFDQAFNGNSIPRGGWGMLNDNYQGYAVSGLIGSITDGGGYAFSMNSFATGFIMAKTAKYDARYASSIGKWLNHLISNARYFFPDYAKDDNESMFFSEYATEAQSFNQIAQNIFPYEGIRKSGNSKSPWFGGDPTVYNWAQTDFSVYSGASMGMIASLYEKTNVDGILKIDLNTGDFFNDSYPTYLMYNPNDEKETVLYTPKNQSVDLYDVVTETVVMTNVSTEVALDIESKDSIIIVEIPAGSELTKDGDLTKLGDVILSKSQVNLNIISHQNNAEVSQRFTLRAEAVLSNPTDEVLYYEVALDGKVTRFDENSFKLESTPGSKTVIVSVYTKNGLQDYVTLRIRVN